VSSPDEAVAALRAGEAAESGSVAVAARVEPLLSVKDSVVVNTIERVLRDINVNLDDWEQIERFTLLDNPLHDENSVLMAGANREEIAKAYMAELEAMYPAVIPFAKTQVTQVQVDPEYLRHLVEQEGILDAWMNDAGIEFLLELARQKKIDAPSMVNICETVATISQMQNEMNPLSTAFLVGDPVRISRLLPESALQLRQYDHIRRMRRIVIGLAKIVDGHVMAYGLDKHGFLRGIHRLDVEMDTTGSDLTGTHYRLMAAISRRCDAVVFSIPRGGQQVRVFSDGRLVGRYVNGAWVPESKTVIDQAVARLADRKEYDLPLLRRLIRCAFRMSERNQGAIFLLGDANAILQRSDEAEIQNIATIVNVPLDELSDDELIAFAKEDGATVVDTNGDLRGCMVLLRPAARTQAQIGPGKGARHSSAAKMSAETDCIAITVSQDGPITVYDAGQRVLAL
jgi:DNA integrity scanning protein DisA with diadenylate cyclase activity